MADKVNKKRRSEIMSSIRSGNTKPEVMVRKYLFSKGLRYRLHNKTLPAKPDIVLKKYKSIVLVNGCFWHGHKNCKNYVMPKTNKKFWYSKIERNILRDKKNITLLKKLGWKVFIVWECKLRNRNKEKTLDTLLKKILKRFEH